jgi:hypothetical protein
VHQRTVLAWDRVCLCLAAHAHPRRRPWTGLITSEQFERRKQELAAQEEAEYKKKVTAAAAPPTEGAPAAAAAEGGEDASALAASPGNDAAARRRTALASLFGKLPVERAGAGREAEASGSAAPQTQKKPMVQRGRQLHRLRDKGHLVERRHQGHASSPCEVAALPLGAARAAVPHWPHRLPHAC